MIKGVVPLARRCLRITKTVEATYEDGVLTLDEPVDLAGKSRVWVQIEIPQPGSAVSCVLSSGWRIDMEPVVLDPTTRPLAVVPLTVEQYHSMRETGILDEDEPVELIDGLLVYKDRGGAMPVSPLHSLVTHRMSRLAPALEDQGCHLRLENSITLPPSHEPEPDGAVVRGRAEDYLERHPGSGDVLCAIEVAESSLKSDRTTKQGIYAAAGIGQFIIVNLVEGRVEVYGEPNVAERCYGVVRVLHRGDSMALRLPGGRTLDVPVADWLPEVSGRNTATV
jgi:Uma2 family endonuclease